MISHRQADLLDALKLTTSADIVVDFRLYLLAADPSSGQITVAPKQLALDIGILRVNGITTLSISQVNDFILKHGFKETPNTIGGFPALALDVREWDPKGYDEAYLEKRMREIFPEGKKFEVAMGVGCKVSFTAMDIMT